VEGVQTCPDGQDIVSARPLHIIIWLAVIIAGIPVWHIWAIGAQWCMFGAVADGIQVVPAGQVGSPAPAH
jgi:hypothetical protein